jgi:hypothetical protein
LLEEDTESTYQVVEFYTPAAEGGLRYDDPRLAIAWPLPVTDISEKDSRWPLLEGAHPELWEIAEGQIHDAAVADRVRRVSVLSDLPDLPVTHTR